MNIRRLVRWYDWWDHKIPLLLGIGYATTASGSTATKPPGATATPRPGTALNMGPAKQAKHGSAQSPYAPGAPGVGAVAPGLDLKSTSGGSIDLSSYAGKQQVLHSRIGQSGSIVQSWTVPKSTAVGKASMKITVGSNGTPYSTVLDFAVTR